MKKLTTKEIRQTWINFWNSKGHEVIPSKSLIPVNDPSLLWINSGVATLKDYFSGKKIPQNPRLTNSQKSLRTNDIENVGVTARHHTFFEMLGNFSIGDYFKAEVLPWAWELLTNVYELDPQKLYITYFDEDQETYDLWIKIGVDPSHLIKGNRETNFWDVGQGPCGPDTEIFFDRGEMFDPGQKGIELLEKDLENDRYVEIWNIVFSQFNNDGNNNYLELQQKNIDTGAGLERLASILQETPTNFETDGFMPLIKAVEKMTTIKYNPDNYFANDPETTKSNKHFKIIADHIRAVSLAIEDGAKPSNTQRGYVLRRLIRRAYRSGLQLGIKEEAFLYELVKVVQEIMDIYPIDITKVAAVIKKEELAFAKTIKQGEILLEKELVKVTNELDFGVAYKLFETYGFPIELTQEILAEKNISLDISRFKEYQEKHADESRGEISNGMESQIQIIQEITELKSKFIGYDKLKLNTNVIFSGKENNLFYTMLEETPFYPTGGGQNADTGEVNGVEVLNVFKDKYGNVWHVTNNELAGLVSAKVDKASRTKREANHSATHLLGYALRQIFGNDVVQLGSDNNDQRLRFDFPLSQRPTQEQLNDVEDLVNDLIKKDITREYIETSFDKGKAMGAITLEGEDYGEEVRVVKFDNVIEFCGGTHIQHTKDIEAFKITRFESKGSGVFRIEAVTTNDKVSEYNNKQIVELKTQAQIIIDKIKKIDSKYEYNLASSAKELNDNILELRQKLKDLKKESSKTSFDTNVDFVDHNGKKTYINLSVEPQNIKPFAIALREAHHDALFIIGAKNNNRTTIAVASKAYDAKATFDELATKFNGKGGGNFYFAMGSMEKVVL